MNSKDQRRGYVSQFMLVGAKSLACEGNKASGYPDRDAAFDLQDGYIPYGALIVDQRTLSHKNCLDYMTDWCSWPDVQIGTNFKVKDTKVEAKLTIQGELDELAANISIGRNLASVHYYSDYYDSLRMGEQVAVFILLEQAPSYGDAVQSTFKSFDGDYVTISGEEGSCPALSIIDHSGDPVDLRDWWPRHVIGREFSEDL